MSARGRGTEGAFESIAESCGVDPPHTLLANAENQSADQPGDAIKHSIHVLLQLPQRPATIHSFSMPRSSALAPGMIHGSSGAMRDDIATLISAGSEPGYTTAACAHGRVSPARVSL